MSRHAAWEPTDADLVAHLLDDLEGARAEYVSAHIKQCPACRARLAELRAGLDWLTRLPDPDDDDPLERAALVARIQHEAAGHSARPASGRFQRARISVAAAAILLVALLIAPALTGAGNPSLRKLVGIDGDVAPTSEARRILPGNMPLPTVDQSGLQARETVEPRELPYAPLAPQSLPGENHLVTSAAFANGSFEAHYAGADGLELLVMQEPATSSGVRFGEGAELTVVRVGDVEAYALIDAEMRSVSQLLWVRGGVLFSLQALVLARDFLPLDEAVRIAERMIQLQDFPIQAP